MMVNNRSNNLKSSNNELLVGWNNDVNSDSESYSSESHSEHDEPEQEQDEPSLSSHVSYRPPSSGYSVDLTNQASVHSGLTSLVDSIEESFKSSKSSHAMSVSRSNSFSSSRSNKLKRRQSYTSLESDKTPPVLITDRGKRWGQYATEDLEAQSAEATSIAVEMLESKTSPGTNIPDENSSPSTKEDTAQRLNRLSELLTKRFSILGEVDDVGDDKNIKSSTSGPSKLDETSNNEKSHSSFSSENLRKLLSKKSDLFKSTPSATSNQSQNENENKNETENHRPPLSFYTSNNRIRPQTEILLSQQTQVSELTLKIDDEQPSAVSNNYQHKVNVMGSIEENEIQNQWTSDLQTNDILMMGDFSHSSPDHKQVIKSNDHALSKSHQDMSNLTTGQRLALLRNRDEVGIDSNSSSTISEQQQLQSSLEPQSINIKTEPLNSTSDSEDETDSTTKSNNPIIEDVGVIGIRSFGKDIESARNEKLNTSHTSSFQDMINSSGLFLNNPDYNDYCEAESETESLPFIGFDINIDQQVESNSSISEPGENDSIVDDSLDSDYSSCTENESKSYENTSNQSQKSNDQASETYSSSNISMIGKYVVADRSPSRTSNISEPVEQTIWDDSSLGSYVSSQDTPQNEVQISSNADNRSLSRERDANSKCDTDKMSISPIVILDIDNRSEDKNSTSNSHRNDNDKGSGSAPNDKLVDSEKNNSVSKGPDTRSKGGKNNIAVAPIIVTDLDSHERSGHSSETVGDKEMRSNSPSNPISDSPPTQPQSADRDMMHLRGGRSSWMEEVPSECMSVSHQSCLSSHDDISNVYEEPERTQNKNDGNPTGETTISTPHAGVSNDDIVGKNSSNRQLDETTKNGQEDMNTDFKNKEENVFDMISSVPVIIPIEDDESVSSSEHELNKESLVEERSSQNDENITSSDSPSTVPDHSNTELSNTEQSDELEQDDETSLLTSDDATPFSNEKSSLMLTNMDDVTTSDRNPDEADIISSSEQPNRYEYPMSLRKKRSINKGSLSNEDDPSKSDLYLKEESENAYPNRGIFSDNTLRTEPHIQPADRNDVMTSQYFNPYNSNSFDSDDVEMGLDNDMSKLIKSQNEETNTRSLDNFGNDTRDDENSSFLLKDDSLQQKYKTFPRNLVIGVIISMFLIVFILSIVFIPKQTSSPLLDQKSATTSKPKEWRLFSNVPYGSSSSASISVSMDGRRLAAGFWSNNSVRIYDLIDDQISRSTPFWNMTHIIEGGENLGDQFGYTVQLSSNGEQLAIGVPGHDLQGGDLFLKKNTNEGKVSLYQLLIENDVVSWSKEYDILGNDINGGFGASLSFDSSGSHLAIGSPGVNDSTGSVSVYTRGEASNSAWYPVGNVINGYSPGSHFGISVSLSMKGGQVAIGAPFDAESKKNGYAYVYKHDLLTDKWNIEWELMRSKTTSITRSTDADLFGSSIAQSSDGAKILVGSPGYSGGQGLVRMFILRNDSRVYDFVGANDMQFGSSVSLDFEGTTMVVGSLIRSDDQSATTMKVSGTHVYRFSNSLWTQDVLNDPGSTSYVSGDGSIICVVREDEINLYK